MASIPNTAATPGPVPAGKAAATAAGAAGFAAQLAGIPLELVRIAAQTLTGEAGGDAPDGETAPAKADDAGEDATQPAAQSDAAQLAALTPMLQALPAMLPASVLAPAQGAAPAPAAETAPQAEAAAAQLPANAGALPVAVPTPPTTGKLKLVKPDAESGEADAESEAPQPATAPETPGKDVVAAARRAIEAAFSPAKAPAGDIQNQPTHAARLAAPTPQAGKEAQAPAPAIALPAPLLDGFSLSAFAAPATPAPAAAATAAATPPQDAAAPTPDRTLDLTNDAEWLDRLARDIAQASGDDGAIRFRLHPQTLGHIQVEVSQGERGMSVRISADSEQARTIIADAQPRLVAEARAQGVRIAETHVDLSGSDRQASGDPRRQDERIPTPLIRTARDAAAGEASPDRPARSRSDRYA